LKIKPFLSLFVVHRVAVGLIELYLSPVAEPICCPEITPRQPACFFLLLSFQFNTENSTFLFSHEKNKKGKRK